MLLSPQQQISAYFCHVLLEQKNGWGFFYPGTQVFGPVHHKLGIYCCGWKRLLECLDGKDMVFSSKHYQEQGLQGNCLYFYTYLRHVRRIAKSQQDGALRRQSNRTYLWLTKLRNFLIFVPQFPWSQPIEVVQFLILNWFTGASEYHGNYWIFIGCLSRCLEGDIYCVPLLAHQTHAWSCSDGIRSQKRMYQGLICLMYTVWTYLSTYVISSHTLHSILSVRRIRDKDAMTRMVGNLRKRKYFWQARVGSQYRRQRRISEGYQQEQ
jgi:hypothetical protein